MKAQLAAPRAVALWVFVCSSINGFGADSSAAKTVTGSPGVVVARRVVNLSDLARQEASLPARPHAWKVQPPERETPPRKPLPPGVIVKLAPGPNPVNFQKPGSPAVTPPQPLAPTLSNSFPAEADDNTVIPPDTQGTPGPNHLVVTLNSNIVVEDRFGNTLTSVSLDAFWAPTGNSRTTDPRVVYDPYNDRWIINTSGDFLLSTSGVLVGVSQTGDPTGNWNLYKVAVDSSAQHFCDFPVLGFNRSWVVVMCNVFANASNSNFFSGNIYVFDKFDLYNHGAGIPTVLNTGGDSNVTPAITYDNNVDTEYMVEEYNGNDTTTHNGLMRLWAITGSVGSPALSSIAFPATTVTWDEGPPVNNFAPQFGSATGIDTGDARIGNVIYRNGTLWTTHPVFYPCCANPTPPPPSNPPNRSAIQWWNIATDGTVLQRGVIDNPDHTYFRSYPSIAVNQWNDALIGYARYSASEFAGGFYSFHSHLDPGSVVEAETALKTGEGPYAKTAGGTLNRWGDYSNTSVDPIDDSSFWTIQEYAASPSSHWGTWWGQVTLYGSAAAYQLKLMPASTTVTAGVPLTDFAVTAVDAQGLPVLNYAGTVHFTSTDPGFTHPDYTFVPSDQGTHHFSGVTLFKAGGETITFADLANAFQGQQSFTVVPAAPAAFSPVAGSSQTAGVPFNFTLTVKDAFQNITPGYRGTVHFTSTDPSFSMPDYTFTPSDSGVHQFTGAKLFKAGPESITVTDAASSLQATMNFTVSPGAATVLVMSGGPTTTPAGTPFGFPVTAQDAFQNVVTGYNQTVQFTSSDPAATLPTPYQFIAPDNGNHIFGATLRRAGVQNIVVSDGTISGTMAVTVTPVSADHLAVSAPANVTSGKAFTVSVTAQDPFNNTATGYLGTVQFSTSDASHTLPANYTFVTVDHGVHPFVNGTTLNTIGTQTVTAADTGTSSINGSTSVSVTHLSGAGRTVYVRLGPVPKVVLADFTDDQSPAPSSFSATIDWGDGSPTSLGTITVLGSGYTVSGNHTFGLPPKNPITITLSDTANGFGPISLTAPVRMWPKTESH
jgi:hypothetical protein